MDDLLATFFARLDTQPPHIPVNGAIAVRVRAEVQGRPPTVVHLLCDEHGFHPRATRPAAYPDAFVDVGEADLRSLVRGEDEMQDLLMTRRIWVSGQASLGHACCQAMATVLLGDGASGRLRPFPGVTIDADFPVTPFIASDPWSLPIVINVFNRVTCLRELVTCLRRHGYQNLYVLDNASDYAPLLAYYQESQLRVFRASSNVGCYALWRTPVWERFRQTFYAFTDPDVLPIPECPPDYAAHFLRVLQAHPATEKVGFGLKIDDIPDTTPFKEEIVRHERKFWTQPHGDGLYLAPIDTTFAVYRPEARGGNWLSALRTAEPYLARHTPWYANDASRSAEDEHYHRTSRRATYWTAKAADYPFEVARPRAVDLRSRRRR